MYIFKKKAVFKKGPSLSVQQIDLIILDQYTARGILTCFQKWKLSFKVMQH